jgi:hypothetical protein
MVADILIIRRIRNEHGVVGVPCFFAPCAEDHLLPRVIGIERRNDSPDGIIEEDRAHALDARELEPVRRREETARTAAPDCLCC